jgi:hypothetical protein
MQIPRGFRWEYQTNRLEQIILVQCRSRRVDEQAAFDRARLGGHITVQHLMNQRGAARELNSMSLDFVPRNYLQIIRVKHRQVFTKCICNHCVAPEAVHHKRLPPWIEWNFNRGVRLENWRFRSASALTT